MKLESIDVKRELNDGKDNRLRINVWYDNGKDYPYNKKGIYVSIIPVVVEHREWGVVLSHFSLYGDPTEGGFRFCAVELEKAAPSLQKRIHKCIEENTEQILYFFERCQYRDIITFVKENY